MTKEFQPNNLTSRAQNPYPESGDIFMANEPGNGGEVPRNSEVPQGTEEGRPQEVSPEREEALETVWTAYFDRVASTDLNERHTQELIKRLAISRGFAPEDVIREGVETLGTGVWRNGDNDQPVVVTGSLGLGPDGREYVSIEGSTAGIPLDEIEFGGGAGGGEPPEQPPTATAGAGGEEPPEEPPAAAGGEQAGNRGDGGYRNGGPREVPTGGISDPSIRSLFNQYNEFVTRGRIVESDLEDMRMEVNKRLRDIDRERLTAIAAGTPPPPEMNPEEREAIFSGLMELGRAGLAIRAEAAAATRGGDRRDIRYRAIDLAGIADTAMPEIVRKEREIQEKIRRGETLGPNDALTPEQIATKADIRKQTEELLEEVPSVETGAFPTDILGAVRYFKELRESLINEILFKSYDDTTETGHYEIDLYASSNLNVLLGYMSKDDPEKYREFLSLKTAANYFHTMNAALLAGNFETFQRVAETINYQHFELMKRIRGSALVMRLFEKKYEEIIARDNRITEAGYTEIKTEVERVFREMNAHRVIESEYKEEREEAGEENGGRMESWEIARALGVGRAFFSLTYRATEKIAVGQVAYDRKQFAGFPFEDMVRVFNWNEWMIRRFRVSEGKHGVEFLTNQLVRWRDLMKDKGTMLGINALEEFGGMNVASMENGGQYKTSGVYSGWRMENMAFDQIKLKGADGRTGTETIKNFVDRPEVKSKIKVIEDRIKERKSKNKRLTDAEAVTLQDQQEYADIFNDLVDNIDIGLSTLIKNGGTGGKGKLAYELRRRVWGRVADTNVPLMVDYLRGVSFNGDKLRAQIKMDLEREPTADEIRDRRPKGLAQILNIALVGMPEDQRSTFMQKFRDKALIRHERMIKMSMGQDVSDIIVEEYTPQEQTLFNLIKVEGRKLAPHLADISFPYMPFMNDIPFDVLDYGEPGQSFYKRRTKGDLGGFNAGQQALFKILNNAGGMKPEQAFEAMNEMIQGIAGPEGDTTAQEAVYSIFEEYMDLIMTSPGKRQVWAKTLAEVMRQPTSRAQEWAGVHAQSIIVTEMANTIALARTHGLLNHELEERAKKRLGARLWDILKAIFWDIAPNVALGTVLATGNKIANPK